MTTELTAGWAVWGKQPGSSDDYHVLASSAEPLDAPNYTRVLTHFAPGTPPTEHGRPGSLPWVTISRMTFNDEIYLGMAIQEPTDDVDGAGRPITRTSYFCLPYASVVQARVGYLGLYRAFAAVRLPQPDGAQVRVGVPALDPADIASDIVDDFGEHSVALTAALLLRGGVTVVGSDETTLEQRLRFIDAASALLPYGLRAAGTAATWSDRGARQQIRLAFAAWPREGASVVHWRREQPPPDGDPAETYHQQLRRSRGRHPGLDGLAALIEFLAADPEPRRFDQSGLAVGVLRDFDLPFAVLDDIKAGDTQLQLVRQVFARQRITELPAAADREILIAALIGAGDPADLKAAGASWAAAVTGDGSLTLTALATAARNFLWQPAPDQGAVRSYLEFADAHDLGDRLLARLVPEPEPGTDLGAGREAVARLVADRVLASQDPAALILTRGALGNHPVVACALFTELARTKRDPAAAFEWLRPVLGFVVAPLAAILGPDPSDVTPSQVARLAQQDPECARLLLAAAVSAGRLERALPGFAGWRTRSIVEHASGFSESRYWQDVLATLPVSDAAARAWVDLVLLTEHAHPRFLLSDPGSPPGRYRDAFAGGWTQLAASQGQIVDGRLTAGFTDYLRGRRWAADPVSAETVAGITRELTGEGRRPRLQAQIAAVLAATPRALESAVVQAWLGQVRATRPAAIREGTLILLREPPAGPTAGQLADLCAQAFRTDLTARETAESLKDGGAMRTGTAAADVFTELRRRLPGEGAAAEWLFQFMNVLADGAISGAAAREFRELTLARSLEEIEHQIHLLYNSAAGGQGLNGPLRLADSQIDRLEAIDRRLQEILKEARPRKLFGFGAKHASPGPVPAANPAPGAQAP